MIFGSLWLKIATGIIAVAIGVTATYYFKMKPDNPVEQAAEMIILQQTGLNIDLSPDELIVDIILI